MYDGRDDWMDLGDRPVDNNGKLEQVDLGLSFFEESSARHVEFNLKLKLEEYESVIAALTQALEQQAKRKGWIELNKDQFGYSVLKAVELGNDVIKQKCVQ